MVSLLAIRPKVRDLKPGRVDGYLRAIKPEAPRPKILQHVKIT
jgi:hypothetical protein